MSLSASKTFDTFIVALAQVGMNEQTELLPIVYCCYSNEFMDFSELFHPQNQSDGFEKKSIKQNLDFPSPNEALTDYSTLADDAKRLRSVNGSQNYIDKSTEANALPPFKVDHSSTRTSDNSFPFKVGTHLPSMHGLPASTDFRNKGNAALRQVANNTIASADVLRAMEAGQQTPKADTSETAKDDVNRGDLTDHTINKIGHDSKKVQQRSLPVIDVQSNINEVIKRRPILFLSNTAAPAEHAPSQSQACQQHFTPHYHVECLAEKWVVREFKKSGNGSLICEFESSDISGESSTGIDTSGFVIMSRLCLLVALSGARQQVNEKLEKILSSGATADTYHAANQESNAQCDPIRFIQRNMGIVTAVLTAASVVLAILWLWSSIWGVSASLANGLQNTLIVFLLLSVGLFVTAPLTFSRKSPEASQVEQISEMAARVRSDISQYNLKVASGFAYMNNQEAPFKRSYTNEVYIQKVDAALQIKLAFASLDKVISTQLANVSTDHKYQQEHRMHVYRSLLAAGSGVFTGFFTYEVGESVLKFIHATQYADDRSLQHWLVSKAGAAANMAIAGKQPDALLLNAPLGALEESVTAQGYDINAATTISAPLRESSLITTTTQKLDKYYQHQFVHHELVGQAWLLTITILAIWIAGFIAWRKPHDESGGNNAHH